MNVEQCTDVRSFTFSAVCYCACCKTDGGAQLVLQNRLNLYPVSSHRALHILVIHLFPQITLNCGLHLRDKWKLQILWTFVFYSGMIEPRFETFPAYQERYETWKRRWTLMVSEGTDAIERFIIAVIIVLNTDSAELAVGTFLFILGCHVLKLRTNCCVSYLLREAIYVCWFIFMLEGIGKRDYMKDLVVEEG